MDFVKREDHVVNEEDAYKVYLENLQKSQLEAMDYQHTQISMEQLHHAMQSSLNATTLVHNFQLPLSPRQMSTLMLKTNQLSRSLNFNEIPAHLPRNLTELDMAHLAADLPQNLRQEDLLTQNLARNLDMTMKHSDLEIHSTLAQTLAQNLTEHDLSRNLGGDLGIPQNVRELPHDLAHEMNLSYHLNRQILEHDLQEDQRRNAVIVQNTQELSEAHNMVQRLDQGLAESLAQRIEQGLAQRLVNPNGIQSERLIDAEHLMPFHIKSEQEDETYFYEMNAGTNLNVHTDPQTNPVNMHQDPQMYVYNNQNQIQNIPTLNPLDYPRQQYAQNFANTREIPENLVLQKQFEAGFIRDDVKKARPDAKLMPKVEEPNENAKPVDQNKIYFQQYSDDLGSVEKNQLDANTENKINSDELSMNIKGQYICYNCNKVLPSKRSLKQHARQCSVPEENEGVDASERLGKFSCSQCGYRCQSPAILKIHERTHTGEKPFSCTMCDYKSGQKNNVVKHILVHMKEKPFRCQYCDYRCAQKNNLVVHERTHTGYKPFACPYCDYRTVQKPNLVKHMYLHTDQKPFSCDMCNYRCVQKTNLTKHKQRHVNEKEGDKIDVKTQVKPYRPRQKSVKCSLCSYRCVQKASLEKHVQFKHGDVADAHFDAVNVTNDINDSAIQNLSVKKEFEKSERKIVEPLMS